MKDVTYTIVLVNNHDGNSMSTGQHLCDKLDFNTGIWWCCDDNNITQLRWIPEIVYSVAPYTTSGKKKKVMKGYENIVSMLYIKNMLLYQNLFIPYGMICL